MAGRGPSPGSGGASRCGPRGSTRKPKASALPDGRLTCPYRPGTPEANEWRRITNEMKAAGTYSPIFRAAVESYIVAWADDRSLSMDIAARGLLVPGSRGNVVANPAARLREAARARMRAALNDLGLTPAGILRAERKQTEAGPSPLDLLMEKIAKIRAGEVDA